MAACIFNCSKTGPTITAGTQRINSIINASKCRGDNLYMDLDLERQIQEDSGFTLQCHKSCVSTYTSKTHISRATKRHATSDDKRSSSEPPLLRRRSTDFDFKSHCFICGCLCHPLDKKNPKRWRVVCQCRTVERPGMKTFKEAIEHKCAERNDAWADAVMGRLAGVHSDLHAADAQYHKDCYSKFMNLRNQSAQQESKRCPNPDEDKALKMTINIMNQDKSHVWTSVELYDLYIGFDVPHATLSRRQFISNLLKYMGSEVIEMKIEGCASLIGFREQLPYKLIQTEEASDDVDWLVETIVEECKSIPITRDFYDLGQFTQESSLKLTSPTLLSLISKLVSNGVVTRSSHSIAQSIQSHVTKSTTPTTLGLALKLHHQFGSKKLITILNEYGYIATYDEVLRFRSSAAKYVGEHDLTSRGLTTGPALISSWCDNYDLNVNTPAGNRETHCMAVEFTQTRDVGNQNKNDDLVIPRLNKVAMTQAKFSDLSAVTMEHYQGPKKPSPPDLRTHAYRPLDVNTLQESLSSAIEADVKWLCSVVTESDPPECEWAGYMTRHARESGLTGRVTDYVFGPLIDATPSHPDTILTTLLFVEKFTNEHQQKYVVLTADMQLFQVVLRIKWSDPERWKYLIPRPGGMHTVMSFVGSIGVLMQGSGLEEIIGVCFGRISSILNGKAWPRSMRAFRMVLAGLLKDHILSGKTSVHELKLLLEASCNKPTGKLWVECFIMPVMILHHFTRAEREGNWVLHLYSMEQMIPYFFAAGHWQYARYITWHCREMRKCLPQDVEQLFVDGEHVCRHRDGSWNAVFADQFGEQTYIRYGKSKGGLVGLTLSPEQVARWVLSNNICNTVSGAMDRMFDDVDDEYDVHNDIHKEEGSQRRKVDSQDREKIYQEIVAHGNPLQTDSEALVNIHNGCIADNRVNVHNALEIGTSMASKFEANLPGAFYDPLHKKVTTMECMKKSIRISDTSTVYDMEKLFGRLLILSQKRDVTLEYLLSYELAPVPSSLFDDYGKMRKSSKAELVKRLGVFTKDDSCPDSCPDCIIIDGNEMLYHVTWPKTGSVKTLCANFSKAVTRDKGEVYVVFDRYNTTSIKNYERNRRAGKQHPDHHLSLDAPLPSRDTIMKNTHNKQQLIGLVCEANTVDTVHMVGPNDSAYMHEEADVNMVCLLHDLIGAGKSEVQIMVSDTDVFLLLVYYCWRWKLNTRGVVISMRKSDGSVVDINATVSKLGEKCCNILAMHALTGCDTTSYPFGKGKLSAVKLLSNVELECIGDSQFDRDVVLTAGRHFFCLLYGSKPLLSMEELRYKNFSSKANIPKIRSLPPTGEALNKHILRCHLQVLLWKSAEDRCPPDVHIEDYGWSMNNQELEPDIGVTTMAPPELMKVVACGCTTDTPCERNSCSCKTAGLSCTSFCKCQGQVVCRNPHTTSCELSDEDDSDSGEPV